MPAELFVPDAEQWPVTTRSRIAPHPYSWLQAVHWVAGAGVYAARRQHGPRFGPTTVRIAELCAELSPCRPGVRYLARRTGLSERTVQYHLQMLREAGLLVYAARGTRTKGSRPQASEFLRAIPPVFDDALGIRTVGEGLRRRPVGIEEAGRKTIGQLGKKARRRARRRRARAASSSTTRTKGTGRKRGTKPATNAPGQNTDCTPILGGSATTTSAAGTRVPYEAELASGAASSSSPQKPHQHPRKRLNKVGRRHQLARELVQQLPWLARTDTARAAWVLRHVADAGWTSAEVVAWLDLMVIPDRRYSPAGLLAYRLQGAHRTWSTPQERQRGLEAARDSRRAEQQRHAGWDESWQPPTDQSVLEQIQQIWAASPEEDAQAELISIGDGSLPVLEDIPRQEIVQLRQQAEQDGTVVVMWVESIAATHGYETAESHARRLFTHRIVDRVRHSLRSRHMVLHGSGGWA
ncbi:transcriptional regulator [Streptomyces xiamenensis]|uniref:transcriptional regulator n=1 Tax=Streptomyces xiamenensis TaxID=408015 RepID=UPI0035E33946